ncbi:daptide biosynthesis intramembrane metalloprotease [Streptomyces sp. NPDC002054]|uniref:daptide biosynthesis intramembrane metalloprotease n=1 Tax=Streptomyces sp. NPDC002054 TaxID=3154663 RepID=UPI003319C845
MRSGRAGAGAVLTPERATALLARPQLAPDVTLHEPIAEDAPWVVQRGAQQYIRVGADMVRLLQAIDGERGHPDLAAELGSPWTEDTVGKAVENLNRMRLLEDGLPHKHSSTWFKFVPPLTFQLTLVKPDRMLSRLAPLLRLFANRAGAVLAAVLALGGLLALASQAPVLKESLGAPLPLGILLGVSGASALATALHEMGHGAVLTHHGGRPSRMGVMLFYLTPAFFCDVSDGWRLPERRQRVQVALAGIVTQLVIAGSAGLASLAAGEGGLRDGMLVFAVSTYLTSLLNLLPFVKLDGYIALMTHLDIPHLRDRTMADARRFLARILFGGRYEKELPGLWWSVPFGLVCMLFPLYLIVLAVTLWLDLLQGMGFIGSTLVLAGVGYLGYRAWVGGRLLLREARTAGARTARICATALLAVAAAGAVLTTVTVPYTVAGGYVVEDGKASLVLSDSADVEAVTQGAEVTLFRRGMVTRTETGTGTVGRGRAEEGSAPMSAFVPVREGDSLPVPALVLPLSVTGTAPAEPIGTARVAAGTRSLGTWLYLSYIAPATR